MNSSKVKFFLKLKPYTVELILDNPSVFPDESESIISSGIAYIRLLVGDNEEAFNQIISYIQGKESEKILLFQQDQEIRQSIVRYSQQNTTTHFSWWLKLEGIQW